MMTSARDENGLYAGPIVDAHHHFWDLSIDKHPWLRGSTDPKLARNCMPEDYLRELVTWSYGRALGSLSGKRRRELVGE